MRAAALFARAQGFGWLYLWTDGKVAEKFYRAPSLFCETFWPCEAVTLTGLPSTRDTGLQSSKAVEDAEVGTSAIADPADPCPPTPPTAEASGRGGRSSAISRLSQKQVGALEGLFGRKGRGKGDSKGLAADGGEQRLRPVWLRQRLRDVFVVANTQGRSERDAPHFTGAATTLRQVGPNCGFVALQAAADEMLIPAGGDAPHLDADATGSVDSRPPVAAPLHASKLISHLDPRELFATAGFGLFTNPSQSTEGEVFSPSVLGDCFVAICQGLQDLSEAGRPQQPRVQAWVEAWREPEDLLRALAGLSSGDGDASISTTAAVTVLVAFNRAIGGTGVATEEGVIRPHWGAVFAGVGKAEGDGELQTRVRLVEGNGTGSGGSEGEPSGSMICARDLHKSNLSLRCLKRDDLGRSWAVPQEDPAGPGSLLGGSMLVLTILK